MPWGRQRLGFSLRGYCREIPPQDVCVASWAPVGSWNQDARPGLPWKSKDKIVSEYLSGQFMVIMGPNEVVRKIKCYLPKNLMG